MEKSGKYFCFFLISKAVIFVFMGFMLLSRFIDCDKEVERIFEVFEVAKFKKIT